MNHREKERLEAKEKFRAQEEMTLEERAIAFIGTLTRQGRLMLSGRETLQMLVEEFEVVRNNALEEAYQAIERREKECQLEIKKHI